MPEIPSGKKDTDLTLCLSDGNKRQDKLVELIYIYIYTICTRIRKINARLLVRLPKRRCHYLIHLKIISTIIAIMEGYFFFFFDKDLGVIGLISDKGIKKLIDSGLQ